MRTRTLVLMCCITLAAISAYAQNADEGYQPATVVAFARNASDAQHMETSGGYKISMRLANIIYNCRTGGPASAFIDWSPGKEFPARVNGKVLQVKNPDGQVLELTITGKKTPK